MVVNIVIFSWQLEVVPAKHFGIRMPTWVCIRKFLR